jgi:hypothetical protein
MNQLARVSLIVASSLLYALSFLWPEIFFFFGFIFLIPLYYSALTFQLTFLYGLLWGFLFWSIHFYGFMVMILEKGEGDWLYIVQFFIIFYFALHAALWFWVIEKFKSFHGSLLVISCVFIGATYFYFVWITQMIFWPCGVWQGYCFANPVIAFAAYPSLLWLLPLCTRNVFLLFIISLQFFCAYAITRLNTHHLMFVSIFIFAVFLSNQFFVNVNVDFPLFIDSVGFVRPPLPSNDWRAQAEEINFNITKLISLYPHINVVVMPESSFTLPLNCYDEAIVLWKENALSNDIHLIIGSPRRTNNQYFNSLYIINRSRIIQSYDKCNLMFLTEFIPNWFKKISTCKSIFLKNKKEFSSKKICVGNFEANKQSFDPYLCSDLYLAHCRKSNRDIPILLAVNDSWFSIQYMKHLMELYAIIIAIEEQRDLLYICHSHANLINKHGQIKAVLQ